jgi:hypothetical protein
VPLSRHVKVLLYTVFKERESTRVLAIERTKRRIARDVRSLKTEQCRQNALPRASSRTIEMTDRLLGSSNSLWSPFDSGATRLRSG